jgi:uncharacterized membrane protein HdeD (DUF308 family)
MENLVKAFAPGETTVELPSNSLNLKTEECLRLHKCWAWFLVLGVVVMAVGAMAIGAAFIATLTTVLVFGILLLAGGVVQIVNAFLARSWRGFFVHLLVGAIHLIVGGLMLEYPLRVAAGLTVLLAVGLLVGGICRIVFALTEDFSGRGWVLANGIITLLLGIAIWRQWPESSLWVIGLFVGIDLLFSGWSWVMLGLIVKASGPAPSPQGSPDVTAVPAGTH